MGIFLFDNLIFALEAKLNKQDFKETEIVQQQIDEVLKHRDIVLDLRLSNKISEELANKKFDELNDKEFTLIAYRKELMQANDKILRENEEIKDTQIYLKQMSDCKQQEIEPGVTKQKYSREEILADIKTIIIYPEKVCYIVFKSYAEIDKIIMKYKQLITNDAADRFFQV